MNKKVENEGLKVKTNYDDKEDLEIKKVAYKENFSQKIFLYVLIILFIVMLSASIIFIGSYYKKKIELNNFEKIEVNTSKSNLIITNLGEIDEIITKNSFESNSNYIVEKINKVEIETKNGSQETGVCKIDIKYNILENEFKRNAYATAKSDVLVRFSYSFDGNHWKYINNVISTSESTLSPLMGNYYDISGVVTKLNVLTNYELSSKTGEKLIMYWRSETIFKNNQDNKLNNKYKAEFKIEYKENY